MPFTKVKQISNKERFAMWVCGYDTARARKRKNPGRNWTEEERELYHQGYKSGSQQAMRDQIQGEAQWKKQTTSS